MGQVAAPLILKTLNDSPYVIQVSGTVLERQSKNSRIDTGDIEVRLESLNVLNAAATPPFTIEDESDSGRKMAEELNIPLLGSIPIYMSVEEGGDAGRPAAFSDGPDAAAFAAIADKL